MKQQRVLREFLNGWITFVTYTNLYNGKDSLGDRIIQWVTPNPPKQRRESFFLGFNTGLITELGVAASVIFTNNPPLYLTVNGLVKTVPRGLERLVNRYVPNLSFLSQAETWTNYLYFFFLFLSMFIRIKKIKSNNYAYVVENLWRKRKRYKVKQKTLKYLGRVIKLEKQQNLSLGEFLKIENPEECLKKQQPKKIILNLIKKELTNHNFKEVKKNRWELNEIKTDLQNKKVFNKKTKKEICLEINNNFFCSYTLRKLLNFNPRKGLTELQIGKQLANAFESSGIKVQREVFVIIAKKILDEIKKT